MIRKYSVLICLVISVILMVIATLLYPGGSLLDKNSTGFDWSKNFFSNLFAAKAINGLEQIQDLGTHWNSIPLAWLWNLFYQYIKKDVCKTSCYCLKTYRCCQHTIYIFNCNPPARHNGNNFKHFVLDWFVLYYCIYSKDKASCTQIRLYYLLNDFLLYLIPIWFRKLGVIGHYAKGIFHQLNVISFRT